MICGAEIASSAQRETTTDHISTFNGGARDQHVTYIFEDKLQTLNISINGVTASSITDELKEK